MALAPRSLLALRWQVIIAGTLLLIAANLLWTTTHPNMHNVYALDWRLGKPIRDVVSPSAAASPQLAHAAMRAGQAP